MRFLPAPFPCTCLSPPQPKGDGGQFQEMRTLSYTHRSLVLSSTLQVGKHLLLTQRMQTKPLGAP